MSWECGGYYTSSYRRNGKVHRIYWGSGRAGKLAAHLFEVARQDRNRARQTVKHQQAELIHVERRVYCAYNVAKLAVQSGLESSGYHQHNRGEWRKKRSAKEGPLEVTDSNVDPAMASPAPTFEAGSDRWRGVLTDAAMVGDKSVFTTHRDKFLSLGPDRLRELAHELIEASIDHLRELLCGDHLVEGEVCKVRLAEMRSDLLSGGESQLARLIVEVVLMCYVQQWHAEKWHRYWLARGRTESMSRFSDRRLGGCQRRLLATLRLLETVRGLA